MNPILHGSFSVCLCIVDVVEKLNEVFISFTLIECVTELDTMLALGNEVCFRVPSRVFVVNVNVEQSAMSNLDCC